MKKSIMSALALAAIIMASCAVEEVKIDYGNDDCAFCKMKIVDKKFSAEIVNEHGKAFKFDAIECLLRYIKLDMIEKNSIELMLVAVFTEEDKLVDAKKSSYVISEDIPSPMGAFLSAYQTPEDARNALNGKDGEVMDWKGLLGRFRLEL